MNLAASKRSIRVLFVIALCVASLIFLSVRPISLGHDLDSYQELFTAAIHGDYLVEPAYTTVSLVIHGLGLDFRGVLVAYAILSISLKLIAYQRITGSTRNFWIFYTLYFLSFYWLYEISQLRASLMLSIAPFLFIKNSALKRFIIFAASLMSHYSSLIFAAAVLKRGKMQIFFATFIAAFIIIFPADIASIFLGPILEKYGGDDSLNVYLYLLHPFSVATALFVYALFKNPDAHYGDIDVTGLSKALIICLCVFYLFLIIGSRTAAFRFIEISNYITFFFSFLIWQLNHKYKFLIISLISMGSFVLMSMLAEVPLIDKSVIF